MYNYDYRLAVTLLFLVSVRDPTQWCMAMMIDLTVISGRDVWPSYLAMLPGRDALILVTVRDIWRLAVMSGLMSDPDVWPLFLALMSGCDVWPWRLAVTSGRDVLNVAVMRWPSLPGAVIQAGSIDLSPCSLYTSAPRENECTTSPESGIQLHLLSSRVRNTKIQFHLQNKRYRYKIYSEHRNIN